MTANPEQFELVEAFADPARRATATHQLAAQGAQAVPVLRAILDESLRNRWRVPYASLGEVVSCALVVCGQLGPVAVELESLVRLRLLPQTTGCATYAASALGRMGAKEPETIGALAACLDADADLAAEAALALAAIGALAHPLVVEVASRSPRAAAVLRRFGEP